MITDTPKDYRPVLRGVKEQTSGVGYDSVGQAEAACDGYRIHYEHDAVRECWRKAVDKPDPEPVELKVDKPLRDWLKCTCKLDKTSPVRFSGGALRHESTDRTAMRYVSLPLPESWRSSYGIRAEYLRDAIDYALRGKCGAVTVATQGCNLTIHNCTRHVLIAPIKLAKE